MRILLLGDVHCDAEWFVLSVLEAKKRDCRYILQVGDFGWWPRDPVGRSFIRRASEVCDDAGIDCYFLDGNHEDYAELWPGGKPPAYIDQVRPRLHYVPRGSSWTWEGVSFVALGGACSIDKGRRIEGFDWFPQELATQQEGAAAISFGSCDVLITHDAPYGLQTFDLDPPSLTPAISAKLDAISRGNRKLIRGVMDELKPSFHIHGHYHVRNHERLGKTRVVGLGDNRTGAQAWAVLSLGGDGRIALISDRTSAVTESAWAKAVG